MKLTLERVAAVLREQGLEEERIGAVLVALTRKAPKSVSAVRQARYRERKAANESVTKSVTVTPSCYAPPEEPSVTKSVTVTPSVTPLARVEDNPSTIELSGKEDKNLGAKASRTVTPTPREILLECLLPETADGVLAHRKAMRRPLTGRAAQLLAKGFLATADPNAAADMMIERGWQGFKPEWFDNERRSNGQQGRNGKGSIVEAGRRLTARLIAAEREGEMQAERGFREGDDAFRVLPGELGKRS